MEYSFTSALLRDFWVILTGLQLHLQKEFSTKSKQLHLISGQMTFTWECHATNQNEHGINLYIVSYPFWFGLHYGYWISLANRGHGVRLYREEAARLDINKSITLHDNNFAVILTVHHNLHCLVRALSSMVASESRAHMQNSYWRDDSDSLFFQNITTRTGLMKIEQTIDIMHVS